MLKFGLTNIYLVNEVSRDTASEIWLTSYPPCINETDIPSILEGVKVNFIKFEDLKNFDGIHSVAFSIDELYTFTKAWYNSLCKKKGSTIPVNFELWFDLYMKSYLDMYKVGMNLTKHIGTIYSYTTLGYTESLAYYDIENHGEYKELKCNFDFTDTMAHSSYIEPSWLVAMYFQNPTSVCGAIRPLIEYNLKNIIITLSYANIVCNQEALAEVRNMYLDAISTLEAGEDIKLKNERDIMYFINPYSKELTTNYKFLKLLVTREVAKTLKL